MPVEKRNIPILLPTRPIQILHRQYSFRSSSWWGPDRSGHCRSIEQRQSRVWPATERRRSMWPWPGPRGLYCTVLREKDSPCASEHVSCGTAPLCRLLYASVVHACWPLSVRGACEHTVYARMRRLFSCSVTCLLHLKSKKKLKFLVTSNLTASIRHK